MSFIRYDMRIGKAAEYGLEFVADENQSLTISRNAMTRLIRERCAFAVNAFSANDICTGYRHTPGGYWSFSHSFLHKAVERAGRVRGFKLWSATKIEECILRNLCLVCGSLADKESRANDVEGVAHVSNGVCVACAPKCSVCRKLNQPRNQGFDATWPKLSRCRDCCEKDLYRCFRCSTISDDREFYGRPYLFDARLDGYKAGREVWRYKNYCRKCRKSLFRTIVTREREARATAVTIQELRRMTRENQKQRQPA